MQHLNPYRFYELATKLHALFENRTSRVSEMFAPLTEAQAVLDGWIKGDPFPLDTSKADAERLLSRIGNLFNKYYIDQSTKRLKTPTGEDRIDAHELALVAASLEKFEHALAAELTHAPTYMAGKRGIFSTYDLIENAYQSFSAKLLAVIPQASQDEFNVAGRALAYGLGTAAGMHLLRAIEIVLKKYYETFSGTMVGKTERTYAIYLKKLAALSDDEATSFRPDKRLLQMLAQIKEHYRNPLVNPESAISLDQAISLFSLATAAITLMVEQIIAYEGQSDDEGREEDVSDVEAALTDVAQASMDDEEIIQPAPAAPTKKAKAN
ncbi:MAG: hypothetical protein PHW63_02845 [Alphaproteobacteria bacterium]|nr:hypothetical protein [Alphaproteobacteria bacterium]